MEKYLAKFAKNNFEGEFNSTHTRMPNKELNIYAGNFCIQNKEEFWEKYYNVVIENNEDSYLTEKQDENGVIAIDLDFRYNHEVATKQHSLDTVQDIICCLIEPLKQFYTFDDSSTFEVYVMEKPNVNQLEDGSLTKDGIHFIIGLNMPKIIREKYRNLVLKELESSQEIINLPLINTWDSVVDGGVLKATTNWTLYGSKKPAHEAYELTKLYEIGYDHHDSSFTVSNKPFEMNFQLFKKLSVQNLDRPNIEMKPTNVVGNENQEKTNSKNETCNQDTTKNTDIQSYYQLLVHGLGNKGFNYEFWLKICGWCVSHISKTDFLNYVEDSWKTQAEEMWNSLSQYTSKCPIYLLEKLVKEKNPEYYKTWRINHKQYLKLKILDRGSNDVARFVSKKLKLNLVYCNDSWIMFDKTTSLWRIVKRPDAMITTHIQREIDEARESLLYVKNKLENDEERNKLSKLEKAYLEHYKTVSTGSYCSQIIKYLTDYLYDADFSKQLDNYKYKIVFKDGILDLKTLEFRKGINQEDFITKTIPFCYQKPKQEDIDFVKLQLKKICNWNDNHLDYYLSTLGYAMTGDSNKEQMFYYLRGQTAENGKSLIFESLEKVMPNYVSKGTSNILDKGVELKKEIPTWKGLLILWLNELSTKTKDEDLVKSLCDGTDYKFGKNYATESEKVRIGFKLFAVSNNSINVKGDEGIKRRFKLEQFNSQFKEANKEDNYETLQFKKDKELGDKLCGQYKDALIYLIFQYSQFYYLEKGLKPYPTEWNEHANENMEDNDKFKSWFDVNIVVDKNGKIAKQDLDALIPKDLGLFKLVDELTRMKIPFTYKSQERIGRKKGIYYGIRTKTKEEIELEAEE